MNLAEIAEVLRTARTDRRATRPVREKYEGFTVNDGYAVQSINLEMALAAGEKLSGFKMGLTSLAKQRDVGVNEAIHGFLLASGELEKGGSLQRDQHIHPRVEPELAVVVGKRLEGKSVTTRQVLDSCSWIGPAMEILDSRFEAFKFSTADVVADNTSAARYVLGTTNYLNRPEQIRLMGITTKKNGEIVGTGCPAATMGDPLLSVTSLVRCLAERGRALEVGQVVLTGGITMSVPVEQGDLIEIIWPQETLNLRVV